MTHTLTCVCGGTWIEVGALPLWLAECNCSYCSKKGSIWGHYPPSQVRFVSETAPGIWKPNLNEHHFCARCGTTTHAITPNWQAAGPDAEQTQVSLNMRMLDDGDLAGIPVEHIDGKAGW